MSHDISGCGRDHLFYWENVIIFPKKLNFIPSPEIGQSSPEEFLIACHGKSAFNAGILWMMHNNLEVICYLSWRWNKPIVICKIWRRFLVECVLTLIKEVFLATVWLMLSGLLIMVMHEHVARSLELIN
ncbi:hypothetical protein CDAR_382261 [Caerostris darwini]|uniref:Uncharacterized protein n=1 Tax=Caerostris darwini TaxID=1538125 RepID=A0AAV4VXZ6_9ARAC|nr:hypothetical protein CDAR_382261 [Caerostris darwini]